MAPIRVTFISLWEAGEGLSSYTRSLRDALGELGAECHVVPYDASLLAGAGRAHLAATLARSGGIAHIQHEFSLFGDWRNPFDDRFGRFLAALPVPVVTTAHSFNPYLLRLDPNRPHPPLRTAKRLARWGIANTPWGRRNFAGVFGRSAAVIVHTRFHQEHLRRYGVAAEVIPHGIDAQRVLPRPASEVAGLQLAGRRVITVVGFILYDKGQDLAVEALARLPDDVVLLLAGGSPPGFATEFEHEVDRRIASAGLAGRALRTGYLAESDLLAALAATTAQAVPHRNVAGSGSLALGLSCGRAIVASDLPQARELQGEFGSPALFRSGDVADFAAVLNRVLADPDYRSALESRAGACAGANSWRHVAQRHLDLYQRVAQ